MLPCHPLVEDLIFHSAFCLSSENHILEDVNKCVIALQEKDVDGLDRTAGAIRGRAARVIHVVTSEMDNYEPGVYTEKVLEATKLLSNTGLRAASLPTILPGPCHGLAPTAVLSFQILWLAHTELLTHIDWLMHREKLVIRQLTSTFPFACLR